MSPKLKQKKQVVLQRQRQILSAAVKIFAMQGFANTKISDIASDAGLSHGLIYHYFKTKDEIFTELIKLAHSHFIGSMEYIKKYNADPLEKIRIFTEIITPKDYSEGSAYYSNIVLQAHSSRGLPKAIKKIISKNISEHNKLLSSLISKGQELGQIIQGDPVKLANAHYSMLCGMQVMHILINDFPNLQVSIIDPETVIRALKDPDYKDKQHVVSSIKNRFSEIQISDKITTYRTGDKKSNNFNYFKLKTLKSTENGKGILEFELDSSSGEKSIAVIDAITLFPLYSEFKNSNNQIIAQSTYINNSVTFNIPGRNLQETFKLHGEYLDSNSLFLILQAFPFESKEQVEFILANDGRGKDEPGISMMKVISEGKEKVSVPAGRFNCHKLKMTIDVLNKEYSDMFSHNFWFTADEPHYLIRYEGSEGKIIELVKIG
jgi:AcrR family transcriptional regulator